MTEREQRITARRKRQRRFSRAAWILVAIVSAQVVALDFVLRGWQANSAVPVFAGIGVSALLFVLATVVFLGVRVRRTRQE